MHIRHFLRCAAAAGTVLASASLLGYGTGAVAAPADGHKVIIEPDPVAPGGEFSVFDGGNCPGETGVATFDGAGIPEMKLSKLRNQVGGTGRVPETTRPGTYTVTLVCGKDGAEDHGKDHGKDHGGESGKVPGEGHGEGHAEAGVEQPARTNSDDGLADEYDPGLDAGTDPGMESGTDPGMEPGTDPGTEPGGEPGAEFGTESGEEPGKAHGDGRLKLTGTMTVAARGGTPVPKGGSHTGLGGGAGVSAGTTVCGGALLAGTVTWGVVLHRRRGRAVRQR
ncbi:hypothetical protein QOM21_29600 [Streptomyces sp. Pv4-95]|uniref:hypothetical protein n=1 Tax=Streptomyces sp. Pv4-95 TaxID=3049543 RepID=UPI0038919947